MYRIDPGLRPGRTAAELLEASKKLYVQTEFLKKHKVNPNAPRMFKTPSEEELEGTYQNSEDFTVVDIKPSHGVMFCIASRRNNESEVLRNSVNSAFRPLRQTPPRPPKSEKVLLTVDRMKLDQLSRKENTQLPNYGELTLKRIAKTTEYSNNASPENGLMVTSNKACIDATTAENFTRKGHINSRPAPFPRRRQTTTIFVEAQMPVMTQSTYIERSSIKTVERSTSTNNLTKSTPDLTVEISPPTPSVTPTTQIDSSYLSNGTSSSQQTSIRSINSPDSGASSWKPPITAKLTKMLEVKRPLNQTRVPQVPRHGLPIKRSISASCRSQHIITANSIMGSLKATDPDFVERVQRWERQRTAANNHLAVATVDAAPAMTSSWMEPSKKDVEELFNSQGLEAALLSPQPSTSVSDIPSDFTSITAQKERFEEEQLYAVTCTTQAPAERPVSLMEKNARVLRWIRGCTMATNC
ncbi:unnamed protein product [Bursaphelenchus okinawaensis]|uniref:Centrosome-associated FAM110 C-terminal domain-containing protein n=1 Tax=Bursaphelenchus okinawaensis TaxID=465554 RepID=A0A811L325_9BILA|nr:unnamed protein product [Bursaphelenchus okinawaensis]CAG9115714.1 unnamed protein product [Bursaphelenchus okinawaensis]